MLTTVPRYMVKTFFRMGEGESWGKSEIRCTVTIKHLLFVMNLRLDRLKG